MAQKKAVDDKRQKNCEKEAKEIVYKWFKDRGLSIDPNTIYIVWFAYVHHGFKCMVSSHMYKNNFFEITVNKVTGEMYYNCFKRFEYVIKPANHETNIDIQEDLVLV